MVNVREGKVVKERIDWKESEVDVKAKAVVGQECGVGNVEPLCKLGLISYAQLCGM